MWQAYMLWYSLGFWQILLFSVFGIVGITVAWWGFMMVALSIAKMHARET